MEIIGEMAGLEVEDVSRTSALQPSGTILHVRLAIDLDLKAVKNNFFTTVRE
jgi:hypothetical protein